MNPPDRPMRASVNEIKMPRPSGQARKNISNAIAGSMNQKPSQFRLVLSWSHVVASRICALAVRGWSTMSAMDEIPWVSDVVFTGIRGRTSRHVVNRADCNLFAARRLYSTIDALQLPFQIGRAHV